MNLDAGVAVAPDRRTDQAVFADRLLESAEQGRRPTGHRVVEVFDRGVE
jgi:hypothetical protein